MALTGSIVGLFRTGSNSNNLQINEFAAFSSLSVSKSSMVSYSGTIYSGTLLADSLIISAERIQQDPGLKLSCLASKNSRCSYELDLGSSMYVTDIVYFG